MQRNRYYSPRSTAWASEGERSHAGLKVFETRCRGAILHACLAENVLSGDKNRRYVSRNLTAGRTLLSSLYVCPGRNCWKKVSRRKLLTYRRLLSTTASFSARWAEGKSPMAFPKRSDRRGSGSCGKRAPDWEAPASSLLRPRTSSLFLVAAWSRGDAICGSAPSPLRPRASSLRSRLPRCGLTQAVFCPLSRCYRAALRRLLACCLLRTRRA